MSSQRTSADVGRRNIAANVARYRRRNDTMMGRTNLPPLRYARGGFRFFGGYPTTAMDSISTT